MRDLFEQIAAEGEAGIDRLIGERQQETVTLDFKEKRFAVRGALDNEDRKTLAKALSAFANSAGGLLIYGVEAKKGDDQVDCAQEAKPIAEIERFASEVTTATGQLLQPRHDGIEVRTIRSSRVPGAGYLLLLVQRSERRPHRSEAKDQKQYFKRAGDNSFEMEHYDIEDAFKRASAPDLEIAWHVEQGAIIGGVPQFHVRIGLFNQSTTTAKYPYLQIANIRGRNDKAMFPPAQTKYTFDNDGDWAIYTVGSDEVINPGMTSVVVRITVVLLNRHNQYYIEERWHGPFFIFRYRLGCENSRMKEGECTLTLEQLNAGL